MVLTTYLFPMFVTIYFVITFVYIWVCLYELTENLSYVLVNFFFNKKLVYHDFLSL